MLKKHKEMLKGVYDAYRVRDARSGQRPKLMKIEHWQHIVDACLLVDKDLTLRECSLCFAWSRMHVTDEVASFRKLEALTFVDFIEALGRLSDYMKMPTREQLKSHGWGANGEDVLAYWLAKRQNANAASFVAVKKTEKWKSAAAAAAAEQGEGNAADAVAMAAAAAAAAAAADEGIVDGAADGGDGGAAAVARLIPKDQIIAGKERPLSVNLELMCDLLVRAMHYKRGANPPDTFSYDDTVKMLKKIDKTNG